MGAFRPLKFGGIRKIFWLQWFVVSILTATMIGPLSPFLVSNLIVAVAGWGLLRDLTSGGEYSNYLLFCAFSIVVGLIIGALESMLLQRELVKNNWVVTLSTILVFMVEALLTTIAFILLSGGLYTFYLPLCGVALLLWVLGFAIPLTVPFMWRL